MRIGIDMTDQQINIAIAEIHGTHKILSENGDSIKIEDKNGLVGAYDGKGYALPLKFTEPLNYCKDLNAIHQAWRDKVCSAGLTESYFGHLYEVVNNEPVDQIGYNYDDLVTCAEVAATCANASAKQRAIALVNMFKK